MASVKGGKMSDTTADAGNVFAFNLYNKLIADDPGKNVFFSPYSISSAMSMVLLGSAGVSQNELVDVLGYKNLDGVHEDNQKTRESIQKLGQGVVLETANRLFPGKSFNILDEFIEKCKKYYGSKVTSLDYKEDSEGARKYINDWVAEQTREKIKDLLPDGSITTLTKLVLVNAVYFKGNWSEQFLSKHTRKQDFYISDGKKVQIDMMAKKQKYRLVAKYLKYYSYYFF